MAAKSNMMQTWNLTENLRRHLETLPGVCGKVGMHWTEKSDEIILRVPFEGNLRSRNLAFPLPEDIAVLCPQLKVCVAFT